MCKAKRGTQCFNLTAKSISPENNEQGGVWKNKKTHASQTHKTGTVSFRVPPSPCWVQKVGMLWSLMPGQLAGFNPFCPRPTRPVTSLFVPCDPRSPGSGQLADTPLQTLHTGIPAYTNRNRILARLVASFPLLFTTSGNVLCSKFGGVWEMLWFFLSCIMDTRQMQENKQKPYC